MIAETARLRRDLAVIDADTDPVRNLAVLTGHRADLIADRVRMINRLRDLLTSVFPSLERAFDYSAHKGALVLLTRYASSDRIRRLGRARMVQWLRTGRYAAPMMRRPGRSPQPKRSRSCRPDRSSPQPSSPSSPRRSLLSTLESRRWTRRSTTSSGSTRKPRSSCRCRDSGRSSAPHYWSVPGICGHFRAPGISPRRPDSCPRVNDSGRRTGNLHRPLRYSRPLRHVLYLSAQTSMMRAGPNRDYYLKKRARGATHPQAVIALARRRIDVLWALLRENRTWAATPPPAAQAA